MNKLEYSRRNGTQKIRITSEFINIMVSIVFDTSGASIVALLSAAFCPNIGIYNSWIRSMKNCYFWCLAEKNKKSQWFQLKRNRFQL